MAGKPEIKYLTLTVCENGFIVETNNRKRVFNTVADMAEWMAASLVTPEPRRVKEKK